MFSQPPEIPPRNITVNNHKSTRKKRKKQKQKNKKEANKIKHSLAKTLSAWAENFTMASTWQLKHQVAMWQARATALEYENQILRETLQQLYVNRNSAPLESNTTCDNSLQMRDYEESYEDCKRSISPCEQFSDEDRHSQEDESDLELEISEEYMAFLRQNFEYRKARDERKKKEAEENKSQEIKEMMDPKPPNDRIEEFKELYGDSWQQVAALDCYISAEFISVCDSAKPKLWPNIPLRL